MREQESADDPIGSVGFIMELAYEVLDAWKNEKYRYVFETLNAHPFILTAYTISLMKYPEDKKLFQEKAVHYCRGLWDREGNL